MIQKSQHTIFVTIQQHKNMIQKSQHTIVVTIQQNLGGLIGRVELWFRLGLSGGAW